MAVSLRPGQRVSNMPTRSWISFVDETHRLLPLFLNQIALRNVEKGQKAEVTFKFLPGKVFTQVGTI